MQPITCLVSISGKNSKGLEWPFAEMMESSILNSLFHVASMLLGMTAFLFERTVDSLNPSDKMGLCCCIYLSLQFLVLPFIVVNIALIINEGGKREKGVFLCVSQ